MISSFFRSFALDCGFCDFYRYWTMVHWFFILFCFIYTNIYIGSMHEIRFLRPMHHNHHARPHGTTLEACDVLRHSFGDATMQVLVNILVQRTTPWGSVKSRLARVCHNVIVTSMLTESHSASPTPYFWRQWFVGIRQHRHHHLRDFNKNNKTSTTPEPLASCQFDRHQQFFGYLDDLRFQWLCHNNNSKGEWRIRFPVVKRA